MTTDASAPSPHPRRAPKGPLRGLFRALLMRGCPTGASALAKVTTASAIVAGAGLVASTAAIHLHLWLAGYRHVPRLGPLFLAQAITGLVLAPMLALGRHCVFVLGAAVYLAASAVGLILSATVGFLGIHDGLGVPWATPSLAVELAGFIVLTADLAFTVYRVSLDR
jgi:hypothetical protein